MVNKLRCYVPYGIVQTLERKGELTMKTYRKPTVMSLGLLRLVTKLSF